MARSNDVNEAMVRMFVERERDHFLQILHGRIALREEEILAGYPPARFESDPDDHGSEWCITCGLDQRCSEGFLDDVDEVRGRIGDILWRSCPLSHVQVMQWMHLAGVHGNNVLLEEIALMLVDLLKEVEGE